MNPVSSIDALQGELKAASPDLVGNADLLRGVLAGCGDCIKILDLEGRLIFMSEGGKRVMEVDDFGALKGCPWPEFWPGEGNAHASAAVETARAGGTARFRGAANTAKGNARYWDVQVSPIFGEDGKPSHLLSISRDITEEWNATELLKKNAERQHFLTEELQHRVKNTLANVMAIANRTFRGEVHEAPRLVFASRLMTLSQAHEALTESKWDRTGIVKIVKGALEPHHWGADRVSITGVDLDLGPKQALALALAINELATNATNMVRCRSLRARSTCRGRETRPEKVRSSCSRGVRPVARPSSRPARMDSARASSRHYWRMILAERFNWTTKRPVWFAP